MAPVLQLPSDAIIDNGNTYQGAGSFADAGNDTWSATVDYGDGSGPQPLPLNTDKSFDLTHTYVDAGIFTVTVTVTDDDGGSDTESIGNVQLNCPAKLEIAIVAPKVNSIITEEVSEGEQKAKILVVDDDRAVSSPCKHVWTSSIPPTSLITHHQQRSRAQNSHSKHNCIYRITNLQYNLVSPRRGNSAMR